MNAFLVTLFIITPSLLANPMHEAPSSLVRTVDISDKGAIDDHKAAGKAHHAPKHAHASSKKELHEEHATQTASKSSKKDEVKKPLHWEDNDLEDDVALDELEAMTIASALVKKAWGPPAAISCRWTPFSNEGVCSKSCGGGNQKQTRRKSPNAAHGGQGCTGPASQTVGCKTDPCPTTTTTTTTTAAMTTAAGALRMADVPVALMMLLGSFTLAMA